MSVFRFELAAVEEITPWGLPNDPSLSWFALTLGDFWIELGDATLFQYTPEALAMWPKHPTPYADYQIASCVRDLRSCLEPALEPLPTELAAIAADVGALSELRTRTRATAALIDPDDNADLHYTAWRWLGERSPWMGYFVEPPRFQFVRLGNEIQIGYDNRECRLDGVPLWTAQLGSHRLSIDAFIAALNDISTSLLAAMAARIDDLAAGRAAPQTPVDIASLREQHTTWQNELTAPIAPREPDVPWSDTLAALTRLGALRSSPV